MGSAKRQRTAQAHAEQYQFQLAEDAMNALEAKNFEQLIQSGVIKKEKQNES